MVEIEIYTDTDFATRVCNLISADTSVFTDDIICSFDFKGISELAVKKAIPLWQDILNGDNSTSIELLKACVVYQTAINLAPNVKKEQIKIQQTTHAKVEFFENSAYDLLIEGLSERLAAMELELNGENFNGFSFVTITNEDKCYRGSGFDVL